MYVDGRTGRAIDLRDRDVDPGDVAAAVAGDGTPIDCRCPEPGPVHERVGVVRPDRSYPIRAALAAAARERGHEAPQDAAIRSVRAQLDDLEPDPVDLSAERERVAEADDAEALREEVATLRGQVEAARERGDDPDALETAMERAVADLTERRTSRIAAEQALDRAREDARARRDRRERRLELEDRLGNLRREARAALARRVEDSFERALEVVPGDAALGDRPGSVEGDEATAALAVCRIAPLSAPVVVAVDRFPSATAARACLDAPVVLVSAE